MHQALPTPLSRDDLKLLVNSMRGQMRQLCWAEPWLYRDVISPLIENSSANSDDACEIWVEEIIAWLKEEQSHRGHFQLQREGQTINVAAYLTAHSGTGQRASSVEAIRAILKPQQRVLFQPLASTSNWSKWNNALVISMQVLAFARWVQYYLRGRGVKDDSVDELAGAASDLALIRPMDEWKCMGGNGRSELALFLDKADELLALIAERNKEPCG